jgi:4-hydroxy-3-polyprenylbenzoate decarboxylase
MRDPELDWINIGTYRAMAHDKNKVGLWTSPGKHGRQIRDKYFAQGKPCPVLISCGHDPMLFLAGGNELRFGLSEFDYSGGHRGLPFDVVLSEVHKLPMPAHSEIVLANLQVTTRAAKAISPSFEFNGCITATTPS